jgi:hypothetical protein
MNHEFPTRFLRKNPRKTLKHDNQDQRTRNENKNGVLSRNWNEDVSEYSSG